MSYRNVYVCVKEMSNMFKKVKVPGTIIKK